MPVKCQCEVLPAVLAPFVAALVMPGAPDLSSLSQLATAECEQRQLHVASLELRLPGHVVLMLATSYGTILCRTADMGQVDEAWGDLPASGRASAQP